MSCKFFVVYSWDSPSVNQKEWGVVHWPKHSSKSCHRSRILVASRWKDWYCRGFSDDCSHLYHTFGYICSWHYLHSTMPTQYVDLFLLWSWCIFGSSCGWEKSNLLSVLLQKIYRVPSNNDTSGLSVITIDNKVLPSKCIIIIAADGNMMNNS